MEFIQMWIIPWKRGLPPSVEQRQYTALDRTDRLLRFLKPEGSEGDGITVAQDVSMYLSTLSPSKSVEHVFRAGRGGYLYLIAGALGANDEDLATGDAAYVLGDGTLRLTATETSELLLVDTPLAR
jgi:redox-sensitive bicupin YhaK (pirin superfamily)